MSTLIFQIHIKQWDKSQRSPADVAARVAMPDRFPITGKPEFFILNRACLIDLKIAALKKADQQGADCEIRPLKKALLADGSVKLERFVISAGEAENEGKLVLAYQEDKKDKIVIGDLNDGWIQAKYTWRYGVEQEGQIFWQYEEVILNAACIAMSAQSLDADYFITNPAQLTFDAAE